ncbi:MAG: hypothetical protein LLG00_11760 [Planctomycetaceae bacterium]|nr:hypothetical protein [Planctomycetaceae bacterium]
MKRATAVAIIAFVVMTPALCSGMAILGHNNDGSSRPASLDPGAFRTDDAAVGARTVLAGFRDRWSNLNKSTDGNESKQWTGRYVDSGIDDATTCPSNEKTDDEQAPPTVTDLAEPATLAIWSFLGVLLGLRVWRRRRADFAWDGDRDDATPPLHRRPWSNEQRTAIRQLIERRGSRNTLS